MRLILFIAITLLGVTSCKTKQQATDKGKSSASAQRDPKKEQATLYLIDAMTAKLAGDNMGAISNFEKCLTMDPTNGAAAYQLSGMYEMVGRSMGALDMAKKAASSDPDNSWYLLHLAYLYQRNGYQQEAVSTFEKLIKKDPNNVDYYFPYSEALLMTNQPDKAIDALNKLEDLYGVSEEIIGQKYRIYSAQGKFQKAIDEVEKLVKKYPYEVRYLGMIAELYEEQGEKEKAISYYEKILKIDPQNGVVHLSLSQYHYKSGDEEKGFEELKLAFASPNLDIDMKMEILLNYLDRSGNAKAKKEAYVLLDVLEKTNPEEAKTWSIYGDFLYQDQRLEESRTKFRKAISIQKNLFPVWNQLMILNIQLEDHASLYEESKSAKELFPTQPSFYYFNGMGAFQTGKYQEAIDVLEEGRPLIIDNNELLFEFYQLLGDAYHKLNQHEESDANYDKALNLKSDNPYLLNNYAYYLAVRNVRLEKAAEMSKKSNELLPDQSSFEDTYAWILFRMKKYEEAKVWFEKAMRHGGSGSAVIVEHYGDVLFLLNDQEGALKNWNKAIELGGSSEKLKQKISEKRFIE